MRSAQLVLGRSYYQELIFAINFGEILQPLVCMLADSQLFFQRQDLPHPFVVQSLFKATQLSLMLWQEGGREGGMEGGREGRMEGGRDGGRGREGTEGKIKERNYKLCNECSIPHRVNNDVMAMV